MAATTIDAGDDLPLTLPATLRRHCAARGGHVLIATDQTRLTYAEADARSRAIAKGLLAAGAGKGSHVGLLLPNEGDFVLCLLAATRIGAVVLPFSTLSTPDELRLLLTQSDTQFLIAADEFRGRDFGELVAKALPELDLAAPQPQRLNSAPLFRHVWFVGEGEGRHRDATLASLAAAGTDIDDAWLEAVEDAVRPADRLAIIHTSGSTGSPKGVIHQHGALIRHIDNINEVRAMDENEILLATAPWFWIAGFGFGLIGILVAGARIVCSNSLDAATVVDLIKRERPTTTNGFYLTVNWLAQSPEFAGADLPFLKRGNLWPLLADDVRPADPTFRHDIYGMSEAGGAVSMSADEGDLPEHMRGAAGRILPGFEARIVDPETGKLCPPGEIGELWLRSPLMMEGYYGKPRSEVFDADGWWRSSDAVAIDADGFVYLKGRLGNMIKTAGANVAPREVEAVLSELTGGSLCIVLGIPDAERGQAVVGVVFSQSAGRLDEAALRAQLKEKLSSYKVPRRILDMAQEDMPTLSSGKVDMPALTRLVEESCAAFGS